MNVEIRLATDADDEALEHLSARIEDGGAVAFAPQLHVSQAEARGARRPGSRLLVAETSSGRLVGSAQLSNAHVAHEDGEVELAWLSGLQVDPDVRRRGVARALTEARLELVEPTAVVGAAIQSGNQASHRNAHRWATREIGVVRVTPVPPSHRRPNHDLRHATPEDLAVVADGLRDFASRHVLAPAPGAEELTAWLGVQVREQPLNSYVVAQDASGGLVAGLGLEEEHLVSTMRVVRMPLAIRAANLALRVVPRDRVMRNVNLRLAWFREGHESAMRALVRHARHDCREQSANLVVQADPAGPLATSLRLPPWLPSLDLQVVVREPQGVVLPDLPVGWCP